jgi:hypothetical protein
MLLELLSKSLMIMTSNINRTNLRTFVMKTAIRNKDNICTTPQRRTHVMVMWASFHASIYTVSVIAYYILDFVNKCSLVHI